MIKNRKLIGNTICISVEKHLPFDISVEFCDVKGHLNDPGLDLCHFQYNFF